MNIVKLLVEHGADVNIEETNGFTPVIEACRFGHIEITLYLMKHGANIFKRDYLGRSIEQLYGNGTLSTSFLPLRHLQFTNRRRCVSPRKRVE